MRFPGGTSNTISRKYCKGVMSALSVSADKKGYKYYDWTVDSGDADSTTVPAKTIVSHVKSGIGSRKQPVILMHDAAAKTTTVTALPEIIEYLQGKGYALCGIDSSAPVCHQAVAN